MVKGVKSKHYMWVYVSKYIDNSIIRFNYCEQIYKIEKNLREQYSSSDDYYDDRHRLRL